MNPERWQQIDKLLEEALEQNPDRRAAFLNEACRGDDELRQEVSLLLSAHGKAEGFTEAGPMRRSANKTSVEEAQPLTGRQIGHYQILSRLGEGGMGIVYKARDQRLDRFVAIKVLPPELVADPDRKRRFVQEAKAASALKHSNIVTIHDIASDNGTDFIVMEYADGKTLSQMIPRRGMRLNEALKVAIQIADALANAHSAGIIHRDLKPSNVMVGENGQVKVLDFGLAKLVQTDRPQQSDTETEATESKPHTEEGVVLGTASYMSPEQAEGKPVDARSDIFSFGSMLYEMVTGQRAFQGDSKMSILAAVLNRDPKPVGEISRAIPRDLEKMINRCLRKDPNRRFQHMADLKVALEELKEESDSGLLAGAGATVGTGSPIGGWRLRSMLVGLAIVLLAITAWLYLNRPDTAQPEGPLTPVPLTSYPGWERSASFSPDGSQVAFAWSKPRQSNADVYIKQIGVEEPFRLTDDPAADENPAWSPDGRTIAFARYLSPERIAYIVKPQRGGPERTIAEFPDSALADAACAWTPDSQFLVVVGRGAPDDPDALFLVSLATLQKHKLTDPPARLADGEPKVSPDGRALVFVRRDSAFGTSLYRLSLRENLKPQGEPEKLGFDGRWTHFPIWTPDGLDILFVSGYIPSNTSLWRMAASKPGSARQLAFAVQGAYGGLDLSRQGGRLAYSVGRSDANIWRVQLGKPGAESKEGEKFIESSQGEMEPAYAPDGKRIAFISSRSGAPEIWVCERDGSHLRSLTSFGGPLTNRPRWSPDGQQIVFYSDASGNRDIYLVRADGGVPRRLTTDPSIDTNPEWSADGKWIYFSSERSGQQAIWKVAESGGEGVAVPNATRGKAIESPDGKFLYYEKGWPDKYSLWRAPTSGGAESLVVDSLYPAGGQVVTNEGIYFVSNPDEKGSCHIRFKDLASNQAQTIAAIGGRVGWGLTVSPDRRSFLYTQVEESGRDLVLVENFR